MSKILTKIAKYIEEATAWFLILLILFIIFNPEYLGRMFAGWVNQFLMGFAEAYPCAI
jgi:hypothetical protein